MQLRTFWLGSVKIIFGFLFFLIVNSLIFQIEIVTAQPSEQLIIYSGRREPLIVPVIEFLRSKRTFK